MTANPRTKIVTDYDVEKLADNYGRLHGCYFLPHQNACELCKREAADFLASLPDAPTPEAIAKQEQDVETLNEIAGWLRNLVYTNDATADQAENYACDLEILASLPDAPPSAPEAIQVRAYIDDARNKSHPVETRLCSDSRPISEVMREMSEMADGMNARSDRKPYFVEALYRGAPPRALVAAPEREPERFGEFLITTEEVERGVEDFCAHQQGVFVNRDIDTALSFSAGALFAERTLRAHLAQRQWDMLNALSEPNLDLFAMDSSALTVNVLVAVQRLEEMPISDVQSRVVADILTLLRGTHVART
jgi:hypothetical protein